MTSTIVPGSTGNCVVVFIVLVHSVFSPVHIGAVEVFNFFRDFHASQSQTEIVML